ncbi:FlgO family outer membrane protein [Magnetococcales bacterium HHB-1]
MIGIQSLRSLLGLALAGALATTACTPIAAMQQKPRAPAPQAKISKPMGYAGVQKVPIVTGGVTQNIAPPQPAPPVFAEPDIVEVSRRIADSLVVELRKNHPNFQRRKPMIVASFVNLNHVDSSSGLGLLMAEQISARLTQQRYTIIEAIMRNNLSVRQRHGTFILSRDAEKIARENKAYAVVAGTYSQSRDSLYVTAKIVKIQNRHALASVSAKLPIGSTLQDLLIETGGATSGLPVVSQ